MPIRAMRAHERPDLIVVGDEPRQELRTDRRDLGGELVRRRGALARVVRDDHAEHGVLRREPRFEAAQIADRRDILWQEIRKVGIEWQVKRRQVDRHAHDRDRDAEDRAAPAVEPGDIAVHGGGASQVAYRPRRRHASGSYRGRW